MGIGGDIEDTVDRVNDVSFNPLGRGMGIGGK